MPGILLRYFPLSFTWCSRTNIFLLGKIINFFAIWNYVIDNNYCYMKLWENSQKIRLKILTISSHLISSWFSCLLHYKTIFLNYFFSWSLSWRTGNSIKLSLEWTIQVGFLILHKILYMTLFLLMSVHLLLSALVVITECNLESVKPF